MFKKKFKYLLVTLFVLITCFGCSKSRKPEQLQSEFDTFLNTLFVDSVQTDTLSLNYSLESPETYGIIPSETTLGEYSITEMKKGLFKTENNLNRLVSFDYSQLSKEQRLTYDILKEYLMQDLEFGDYLYYNEVLGPTTGIQAQLPILLAEYSFYSKEDIDQYIALLSCVDDYFGDIVRFEKKKSERGLFMRDAVADRIIGQCEAFIESPENNFLIEYFNEKVKDYNGLTETEITYYEAANKKAVLEEVIPAYEKLIAALQDLKGSGINDAGLYYYPEGQAYYELLAKHKTGSNRSVEEMADLLEGAIQDGIVKLTTLSLTDAAILDKYMDFTSFPLTDPEEILHDLKGDIAKDFPEAVPVNCQIKYVHKSLSDYLSPAMYLVPPIDDYRNNSIYINGNDTKTLATIYTTVAHEGYPGHLYQCVYFRNQNPAPIRSLMDFAGYDEGWATYVEMYSYHLAGIDENLASFLEANNIIILCMYARADIGIHYEGWKKDDTIRFILKIINDAKIAESIYNTLLEEPAIYLPYAIGFLEIRNMREKAEDTLGDKFVMKEFHQFFLDIGPAQFDVIDNRLETWMKEQSAITVTYIE
ncbi:MAG: DUF885 domain-containing protein [Lachnospiraceae bacterium]|nr:DUF885 domain-containing protein [Lachnospiraceae bacterium]